LETLNKQLGVVTSIAGQKRYTITLKGEANHAGTTPMGYRRDTVYAFSRICYESIAKANAKGDPLVLTFGRVEPKPNTVNVVPGEVVFSMDCRHTDSQVLHDFTHEIEQDIQRIAGEMGISAEINLWMDETPIPMDPALVRKVEQILHDNQIDYHVMHSGAGHDSQIIAPRASTMMLFVPSIAGISHNPAEETAIEDLAAGINALIHVLYQLAYQE
ncbi:MAG: hydantoinase/carbamoylase family amidase, partial [Enterobacteriaceae bacterium]